MSSSSPFFIKVNNLDSPSPSQAPSLPLVDQSVAQLHFTDYGLDISSEKYSEDVLEEQLRSDYFYDPAPALEPQNSMDSQLSEGRSTIATEDDSYSPETSTMSRVVSSSILDNFDERFLTARLKAFMEASRPGLIWSGGKLDALDVANHADQLLDIIDEGQRRVLEALREFSRLPTSDCNNTLIDCWIWVLVQGIKDLQWQSKRKNELKEHLAAKLNELSMDLTQTCRILMKMSVHTRIAQNLLCEVVRNHSLKFPKPPPSILYQKIKPNYTRFMFPPKLGFAEIPPKESLAEWTPQGNLVLKHIASIERTYFKDLHKIQKLALLNIFFDEIRTDVIKTGFGKLLSDTATHILNPIASSGQRFGQKPTLSMKPTKNKMEKHILSIQALLNKSESAYWDKTMGYVLIEYLTDIIYRMSQLVQVSEATSDYFQQVLTNLEKIDLKFDKILKENFKDFSSPPIEKFSIGFSTSAISDEVFLTFEQFRIQEKGDSVSGFSMASASDGSALLKRNVLQDEKADVSSAYYEKSPPLRVGKFEKFIKWIGWKKTKRQLSISPTDQSEV